MPSRARLRPTDRITTILLIITLLKTIVALDLAPLGLLKLLSVFRILSERILLTRRRLVILEGCLNLIELALVRTGDRARPAALAVDDVVTLFLLALALFALHAVHLLAIAVAVECQDVEAREVCGEVGFQYGEELGVRSVGTGVVVDYELIVAWIFGRVFLGWTAVDVFGWM